MADGVDVILQMWLSRWEQIRHSENQRAQTTNMILVLAAAGLGFIAQKGLKMSMLPVAVGIFALGTFGALLSVKYYERFRFHFKEATALRGRLDDCVSGMRLTALYDEASKEQLIEYPRLTRVPLFGFWLALHIGIALAGAVLLILIATVR